MKLDLRKKRKWIPIATVIMAVFILFISANAANAIQIGAAEVSTQTVFSTLAGLFSMFLIWIAGFVSGAVLLIMKALFVVMSYTEFIDHPVVTSGWRVVRDIVNTGFIALLLIIALGTIFGVEKVKWQQQIVKLIIAAIAINFSRLIVGLFIDFGQVIMIAFVNALQATGPANFIDLVGMRNNQALTARPDGFASGGTDQLMDAAFALSMITIVAIVLVVILAVLVYRVIIIWILIILSPAAFLAGAANGMLSQASSMYSNWWGKLTAAIMIGPILTFFIWLALASVGNGLTQGFETGGSAVSIFSNQAAQGPEFFSFLIGIGLLLGGLEMAQSSASALGGMASAAVGAGQKISKSVARLPVDVTGRASAATLRKGVGITAKTARAGGAGVSSLVRGSTKDWREAKAKKRESINNRRAASSNPVVAAYGRSGQRKDVLNRAKQQNIAKKLDEVNKPLYENHTVDEAARDFGRGIDSKSERRRAGAISAASTVVDDEERFAEQMAKDPEQANRMLKEVRKHKESIGDDAGLENIDKMMDRNIHWKDNSSSEMRKSLDAMSTKDRKALDARNFDSAEFRKAAADSGMLDRLHPTKQTGESTQEFNKRKKDARSGYSKEFLAAAAKANNPGNIADTGKEVRRVEGVRAKLAGKNMNIKANRDRQSNNEAIHGLENAVIQGNVGEILKSGKGKLEDIDINHSDNNGPDVQATIDDIIGEVIGNDSGIQSLQAVEMATRSKDADEKTRATEMKKAIKAKITAAMRSASPALKKTLQANEAAIDGNINGKFDYDAHAGGFRGTGEADFQAAAQTNPNIILSAATGNINKTGKKIDPNQAIVGAVTEAANKKMFDTMLDNHDNASTPEAKDLQREVIYTTRDIIEQGIADMKAQGASKEDIKAKKRALKYLEKRIISAVKQSQ